jgi:hypothetical protein
MNLAAAAAGGLVTLLGLVMASARKRKTSQNGAVQPPSEVTSPEMDSVLRERMARAVLTQDPAQIEAMATELRRRGWTTEADRLTALAAELRARQRGEPIPDVTIPGGESPEAPDQALAFKVRTAQTLMDYLKTTRKYKEDKTRVKAFQALADLKQDGLYGAKSALAAAAIGVIPVKPFYWAKGTQAEDKNAYRSQLTQYAMNDPNRAAKWQEAAAV